MKAIRHTKEKPQCLNNKKTTVNTWSDFHKKSPRAVICEYISKKPYRVCLNDNMRSKLAAKDSSNSLDSLNSVYKKRWTHVEIPAAKGQQFPGIIALNYSLLKRVSSEVITKLSCESDRGEVQTVQRGSLPLNSEKNLCGCVTAVWSERSFHWLMPHASVKRQGPAITVGKLVRKINPSTRFLGFANFSASSSQCGGVWQSIHSSSET